MKVKIILFLILILQVTYQIQRDYEDDEEHVARLTEELINYVTPYNRIDYELDYAGLEQCYGVCRANYPCTPSTNRECFNAVSNSQDVFRADDYLDLLCQSYVLITYYQPYAKENYYYHPPDGKIDLISCDNQEDETYCEQFDFDFNQFGCYTVSDRPEYSLESNPLKQPAPTKACLNKSRFPHHPIGQDQWPSNYDPMSDIYPLFVYQSQIDCYTYMTEAVDLQSVDDYLGCKVDCLNDMTGLEFSLQSLLKQTADTFSCIKEVELLVLSAILFVLL